MLFATHWFYFYFLAYMFVAENDAYKPVYSLNKVIIMRKGDNASPTLYGEQTAEGAISFE